MAKRGLSLLLALAALFSLSVPAFAEEEEAVTAEEVVTEEPVIEPEEVTEEAEAEPETAAEIASGKCGNNVRWSLSGTTLTISGTGAMENRNSSLWSNYYVENAVIESGVTSIGDSAFNGCISLKNVSISGSVTSIGENAFNGCTSLQSVTIPGNVVNIGGSAFRGCTSLASLTIENGVTNIGGWSFYECKSLPDVTIPGSVTSIGDRAFLGCDHMTSLTIENGVISIGGLAFYGCTSLTSVTIPASVASIGGWSFKDCTSMTSATILSSAADIGELAFENCKLLKNLMIGNGVTNIGRSAFSGCVSLEDVAIPGSVASIESTAFINCSSLVNLTIEDGVTSIGGKAFYNCPSLQNVTIPASVTSVGYEVFSFCSSLKSMIILNPNCDIKNSALGGPNTMVIYGYLGSTAQAYAFKNGYTFESLGEAPEPTPVPTAEPTPVPTAEPTPVPTATPKPQLAAPTVKIEKVSTGIKVSWNKVAGSPRYMVYYKEGNGGWKKIGTTTSTTYTRAAKYLKNNVTYTFTVRCCENDKKTLLGPYKASNSVKYVGQLAAPTVKIAKAAGGIKVSWNKVTGSPRYMVYYKEGNGGWKKIGTTTATSYTRAAKYLKNGVTYQFTVRCCENDKKTLLGPYKASNSLKYTK